MHRTLSIPDKLKLIMWPVIINGIDICYMLNVCVFVASDQ